RRRRRTQAASVLRFATQGAAWGFCWAKCSVLFGTASKTGLVGGAMLCLGEVAARITKMGECG
ncbi:MAG: hypothetical protein J6R04_04860, partial [Clostridia bacterium]|nr:hypothetical protein [Clostridia bacterium]